MDGLQPQTIPDKPIPLLTGSFTPSTGSTTDPVVADSGASVPTTHVDTVFPPVVIATETISQSLNTSTKAILGTYTFEQLGAIVVGLFKQGISGEIKMSPDGIVAKNTNGDTTFALDGKTGDATFSGTVKAGDVQVIDGNGLISLASFVTDEVSYGSAFTTNSGSYLDVPDMILVTADLPRAVNALIFVDASLNGSGHAAGDWGGQINVGIVVNNEVKAEIIMRAQTIAGDANSDIQTLSSHQFVQLPSGISTIKLQMKATQLFGNFDANGINFRLTYVILGR